MIRNHAVIRFPATNPNRGGFSINKLWHKITACINPGTQRVRTLTTDNNRVPVQTRHLSRIQPTPENQAFNSLIKKVDLWKAEADFAKPPEDKDNLFLARNYRNSAIQRERAGGHLVPNQRKSSETQTLNELKSELNKYEKKLNHPDAKLEAGGLIAAISNAKKSLKLLPKLEKEISNCDKEISNCLETRSKLKDELVKRDHKIWSDTRILELKSKKSELENKIKEAKKQATQTLENARAYEAVREAVVKERFENRGNRNIDRNQTRIAGNSPENRTQRVVTDSGRVTRKLEKERRYAEEEMKKEKPDSRFKRDSDEIKKLGDIKTETLDAGNFKTGVASAKGKRYSMEDAHDARLLKLELNGKSCNVPYFSVFDGHGGSRASKYAKDNMPKILQETLRDSTESGIWNALKEACVKLDEAFKKDHPKLDTEGTTAVFSLVIGDKLWTANVGDSRAILVRKNETIALTADANPSVERFKQSVEAQGGKVFPRGVYGLSEKQNQVGAVAVARAIGDAWAKGISAEPEITCISKWNPKTDKLILACDGPFKVASRKQVADLVRNNGNKFISPMSPEDNAKSVIEHASQSSDNMTVMVVEAKKGLFG